jgi:hypothetical protein
MLKTYTTPRLVAQGNAIDLTKASSQGVGDPITDLQSVAIGSVGFNL